MKFSDFIPVKQRQAEKKLAEESGRRPGRKRKNPVEVNFHDLNKFFRACCNSFRSCVNYAL